METKKRMPAVNEGGGTVPADQDATDEHGEDGTELGAIRVHNSVIAAIARLAALKVPGVVDMSGSFAEGLASMVGKASFDRGIKVDMDGQKLNLDLHIVIAFGVRIPQVAWRIQNDVRKAIEDMTGKKVGLINVIVQGVRLPDPAGINSGKEKIVQSEGGQTT
ncbi:MAG: Asp23/Gls24 family envelope stress response protein [Kiritimatiellae bacterium]|nr:Asp23/Gls24 family envelope stress response protein [Kiritimatiellia bacterium]